MSSLYEEASLSSIEAYAAAAPRSVADDKIIGLIAEIRRLREVIKKCNHCVDCGKLNPIYNVCDECLEAERVA